jgi:hypothetical protein
MKITYLPGEIENYIEQSLLKGIMALCDNIVFMIVFSTLPMLSGSAVSTAWRVLGLRIEETASRYGG